jgi:uncharacterized protein
MTARQKYEALQHILKEMGTVAVAYSGGVDSTFLLKVAYDVLKDNAVGILAVSPSFPSREYQRAVETAGLIGARLEIIHTNEMDNPDYTSNPVNRCYFCKSELFERIAEIAASGRYSNMVDGSNVDDLSDYRPGLKAVREKGVRSPLQEAGLTKSEIRELSRSLGLPTWDKDALACVSSRFPFGEKIELWKLKMVDQPRPTSAVWDFIISEPDTQGNRSKSKSIHRRLTVCSALKFVSRWCNILGKLATLPYQLIWKVTDRVN